MIKTAFYIASVLLISYGIFFVSSDRNELKNDLLGRSLSQLGQELLQLISHAEERAAVKEEWQSFSRQAEKGEIPPERIERVAVGILNAGNLEEGLSLEDAKVLLSFSFTEDINLQEPSVAPGIDVDVEPEPVPSLPPSPQVRPAAPASPISKARRLPDQYVHLGERLNSVLILKKRLREVTERDEERARELRIRYRFGDRIKVLLDTRLQDDMSAISEQAIADVVLEEELIEWLDFDSMTSDIDIVEAEGDSILWSMNPGDHESLITLRRELSRQQISLNLPKVRALSKLHQLKAIDSDLMKEIIIHNIRMIEKEKRKPSIR